MLPSDNFRLRRAGDRRFLAAEKFDRFGSASPLRPVERVQTEIVAHLRVSTRFYQEFYEICAAEDDGKDQRRLTAARSFIYVRAIGQ